MAGGRAERRLRGRHGHGVGLTVLHEEPHLVIGHVAARQAGGPLERDDPFRTTSRLRSPDDAVPHGLTPLILIDAPFSSRSPRYNYCGGVGGAPLRRRRAVPLSS